LLSEIPCRERNLRPVTGLDLREGGNPASNVQRSGFCDAASRHAE